MNKQVFKGFTSWNWLNICIFVVFFWQFFELNVLWVIYFSHFLSAAWVTGAIWIKCINVIKSVGAQPSKKPTKPTFLCGLDSISSRLAARSWQIQHLWELSSFKCSIKIFIFFNEIQAFYCSKKKKKNYSFNVPAEHLSGWHLYIPTAVWFHSSVEFDLDE